MSDMKENARTIGLFGATRVGVGAIVGGGIFVLAGVAFSATGPGAVVAFALNGVIAALTILSFAEMSTAFPESGGAYIFGKRVLSVRAAFGVGWIVWLAYIVAAVLYALGFASYAVEMARELWELQGGTAPEWITGRSVTLFLAFLALATYSLLLIRRTTGGGEWSTIGKLVVFVVLIIGALWALVSGSPPDDAEPLKPFFSFGASGLFAAMGFTFIAVQGFDLIPAIGGEIKNPSRNIPKAMFLSLGCAMAIYLPLLLLVAIIGVEPGESIGSMSTRSPETVMASAAENFMGATGLWLVIIAAILSTLSALQANLLAASRVALTMARDRTLPKVLARMDNKRHTPVIAVYASGLAVVAVLLVVPDLAAAGAAASLIFLVSFALAHVTAILARIRGGGNEGAFRTPFFPLVPVIGGLACAGLAVFQAVVVPAAGLVVAIWLGLGVLLYFALFATRAEAIDAAAEARDPDLVRLRGRSPLVLVPLANPENALAMVEIANAMAPPKVGRVLLLSVVAIPDTAPLELTRAALRSAERVLQNALSASIRSGLRPEMLVTMASAPWPEIRGRRATEADSKHRFPVLESRPTKTGGPGVDREIGRVARTHRCESLLLGLTSLADKENEGHLEQILSEVDCDVSVLSAPAGWNLDNVDRILVPIADRGGHDVLRARLLGSLCRAGDREVTFLRVLPKDASTKVIDKARLGLEQLCEEEALRFGKSEIVLSNDISGAIADAAGRSDLVVVGMRRVGRRQMVFGALVLRVARTTLGATIIISRGH
jgi:basic amino acid/polyamine antiporter, APA family